MEPLTLTGKVGFGLGHVLNDLCASMWFTYLLLFYHKVLYFNNSYAGVILLVGQIADGLSTTFVGFLSDRPDNTWLCRKYGKRKSWHLLGTICILGSFPFIFLQCLGCGESDEWAQLIYYSGFAVIFQFGWACVQISHLSLIPGLSSCQNDRTGLTAIRYSMTVASNICVYLIAMAFFGLGDSGTELSDQDEDKFRNLMLIVIGLGTVASILFHLLVKEEVEHRIIVTEETKRNYLSASYWFTEPQFYIVALLYMSTRLFVNLSQTYIPLYIQESLELPTIYIAIIPLVMYISGFITSFLMKVLNRKAGRKVTYLLGSALCCSAAVWVFVGAGEKQTGTFFRDYGIFFTVVLYGSGGSTILITSLALTAELIGKNHGSSAFVYGAMSFTDKVSNGLVVMLIQYLIPCLKCCPECKWFFRDVLFYATGGSAVLGIISLLILSPFTVGERRTPLIIEGQEIGGRRTSLQGERRTSLQGERRTSLQGERRTSVQGERRTRNPEQKRSNTEEPTERTPLI
ncbi:major facilitator superfamily domain-containing protein 12 [Eurytemora carolleeae]|uniref:major facilitator superfamily domain-containing protein 12 n=1 Tax=Eurytemora carolleeae TaxID=1294199 RepID=UPI000C77EE55|nr:major facilitator superfamily domain-containing protein 12 [Eurytemora carolleeae]|eukprot:XP_023336394.1 major facilitator superfamily domain-containing protein 12-like [Eurytemora affinis]